MYTPLLHKIISFLETIDPDRIQEFHNIKLSSIYSQLPPHTHPIKFINPFLPFPFTICQQYSVICRQICYHCPSTLMSLSFSVAPMFPTFAFISHMQPSIKILNNQGDIHGTLRWFGHIERMENEEFVKKVYQSSVEGHNRSGRPLRRWEDKVKESVSERGVRGNELK